MIEKSIPLDTPLNKHEPIRVWIALNGEGDIYGVCYSFERLALYVAQFIGSDYKIVFTGVNSFDPEFPGDQIHSIVLVDNTPMYFIHRTQIDI